MFLNYHFNFGGQTAGRADPPENLNGFEKEKAGIMPAFSLLQQGSREFSARGPATYAAGNRAPRRPSLEARGRHAVKLI
jgi:hypothetical protein